MRLRTTFLIIPPVHQSVPRASKTIPAGWRRDLTASITASSIFSAKASKAVSLITATLSRVNCHCAGTSTFCGSSLSCWLLFILVCGSLSDPKKPSMAPM